jgi:lipopolysaccharide transport system ATP-binding protein
MSSDLAIKIDSISKAYEIYEKPIDRLKQMIWRGRKKFYKEFNALDNISFEIKKGETVAIVGSNGAGKSTLLQVICGTLTPTSGEVKVNGRVAALLELGAGFNPEFTGRENVFMSAAILGLEKYEIEARFEKIAAFADIGEFIDHPVKTYSSGMYVRLAFAVIAHVDADILVIDEALAVGDAIFTQKCMRYIRAFQSHGTLLFVSHDMGSVLNLCKTAVWLDSGRVKQISAAKIVADEYLRYTLEKVSDEDVSLVPVVPDVVSNEVESNGQVLIEGESSVTIKDNLLNSSGWETGEAKVIEVSLKNMQSGVEKVFAGGEKVCMTVKAKAFNTLDQPILGFIVKDRLGQVLFGENTFQITSAAPLVISEGESFYAEFIFDLPLLPNGQYMVLASVANGGLYDNVQHHYLHDALVINISSGKNRWGLVGIPFEKVSLSKCK